MRRAVRGVVLIALAGSALAAPAAAHAASSAQRICTEPGAGDWETASPGEVGLSALILKENFKQIDARLTQSALIIRHGCLAGISDNGRANYNTPAESWSMSKSIVSMAAMRAMTLGLLSPDDRVGALLPQADLAHGAITVRQLLTMTSGLHWNLLGDYGNVFNPDGVHGALTLKFDDVPGTKYTYHQAAITLLTRVIEKAVGEPFQQFLQRELLGPIGIARSRWYWATDGQGATRGFYGLQMPALDYARLGQLMLREGNWNGNQLIDRWWVRQARTPTAANPGYGWLFWPSYNKPGELNLDPKPADAYRMSGLFDQSVVIIPSLDTVYVRMGAPSSDLLQLGFGGLFANEGAYNTDRWMMQAFISPSVKNAPPWRKPPEDPNGPLAQIGLEPGEELHPEEVLITLLPIKEPLPPAGPAIARTPITPDGGTLAFSRGGSAKLPIGCPKASVKPCAARVTLTTTAGRPLTRSAPSGSIAPGTVEDVTVKLGPAGRRLLARGQATVRVSMFGADSAKTRWSAEAVPPLTAKYAD